MAMNRETKRMLQRQGELGEDGQPASKATKARQRQQAQARSQRERTGPIQFLREVRVELRKVAWPTREEVINYSVIVLITMIVLTALIFVLDLAFGEGVLRLLNADT